MIISFRFIDGHDLHDHDRKILHCLASRRLEMLETETKAQSFRQKWAEEYVKWQQSNDTMQLLWRNEILQKRRLENDFNEKKLMDAKEKLLDLQLQLRLLIEKKQEKSEELVARAFM